MKIKIFYYINILLLSIFLFSCNDINTLNYTITIINDFDNSKETIDIIDKNTFTLDDLPNKEHKNHIFLGYSFENNNDYLKNDIEYQISNDLTIYAKFGISKSIFKIDSIADTYIFANDPILNKTDYVDAKIKIYDKNYELKTTSVNIRLRGNSSLTVPKKSYKLKFNDKQDIFNMGSDKEWALIANYFDPSHLRNYYAYKLALAMQIPYSVECKFTNLYLNNKYQGLYLFCETVKTNENRVNIEDGFKENSNQIPFLIELDYKQTENNPNYFENLDKEFFFLDNSKYNGKIYPFSTKYPKDFTEKNITSSQYKYIKDYMNNVYKSVRNGNYEEYIDVDSFIDYFIVQELFMNIDQDYSSVFMYKPFSDKLHMGPLWDFDLSSGNCSYVNNYDPFHKMKEVNGGSYLLYQLLEYEDFYNKFKTRLKELDQYIIPLMINSFNENYEFIKGYMENDNNKWQNLNEPNWARPENLLNKSQKEQVYFLKNYLEQHYYWMLGYM